MTTMIRSDESVLITGGTGTFGHAMVRELLSWKYPPKRVIVLSRDEFKQGEMAKAFGHHRNLRFFLGDVRDAKRMDMAMADVQYVFHAAALKQVPACEYNPLEAVRTNILGAANVIGAAIASGVRHVVALSSDKAVNPVNLYGATKLVSEKLFIAANAMSSRRTHLCVVRYGNVLASRGSVVALFREQMAGGKPVTVTHRDMTRFWWTVREAVRFVLDVNSRMIGGEVFLPKLGSSTVVKLVEAIRRSVEGVQLRNIVETGVRPGEKMHEVLMASDEACRTHDLGWCYAVYPALKYFDMDNRVENLVPADFSYCSSEDTMAIDALVSMLNGVLYGNP